MQTNIFVNFFSREFWLIIIYYHVQICIPNRPLYILRNYKWKDKLYLLETKKVKYG